MRNRAFVLVLFLCLSATLHAQQEKDFAGRIRPGRSADYKTCTVSPSGALWLCWPCHDDLYHTDSLSKRWIAVPDSVAYDKSGRYNEFFVIVCPDSDKVLVFGKIHIPIKKMKVEKYYLYSPDRGKSWEYRAFAGNKQTIKAACHTRTGHVWVADDSLYYSDNAGESFECIRPLPSITDIFTCEDNQRGIACQYRNGIFITDDNWQHVIRISTPYDQGLLPDDGKHKRCNYSPWCYQVLRTDSCYLVNQEYEWYVTRNDTILWQRVPVAEVVSILVNPENGKAVILSDKNILQTSDFQDYDTIKTTHIHEAKNLIGVTNGQIYGIYGVPSDSLFCIDLKDGSTKYGAYFCDDIPIRKPEWYAGARIPDTTNAVDSSGLWGYSENDVIRYDTVKKRWYRLLSTDFLVRSIMPYRDEKHPDLQQVLISDGIRHYLVSDTYPTLQPFRFNRPLDSFLQYPVNEIYFETTAWGCHNYYSDEVIFTRKDDLFQAFSYLKKRSDNHQEKADTILPFHYSFAAGTLDSLLNDLNLHYDTGMTQAMFHFEDADFEAVFSDSVYYPVSAVSRQLLRDTIPKLSDSLLTYILTTGFSNDCYGGSFYNILLINSKSDTLSLSMSHHSCALGVYPYIIPFQIKTGDKEFFSTHFPIMQFLGDVMPAKMIGHYQFSNKEVLYKIMRYLTVRRSQDWERYFVDF